jgi:hypothetical protein
MLFGAVALTGVLAAVSMQTLTGPVTTITRVTQRNVAENNLLMNGKILINAAVAGVSGGDADADGIIEPAPFIAPGGGEAAPSNGGFLPTDLGLALTDPWGTKYGYCVWDHGTANTSANRITGDDTASAPTQPVIAIIAAGPDKAFQTSCPAWSGGPVTVSKAAGSDDLIEHYTYAEATASSNGLWSLNASDQAKAELKDSGGTVNVTIDRSTGIGDFLGITTDTLVAKTSNVTLDGGLKLDTETNVTACAAADAGVIRFNAASGKLEVCNGTAWRAAGSDLWLESGTHIYSGNTGNVGIGTNAPAQKLDVVGNTAVSGNSTIGGTLGVTGATVLGDTISVAGAATLSSTLAVTGAATLSSTLDVTGNTNIDSGTLFVDAANNRVGLGTTTPALPLTIAQGAKSAATSLLARFGTADASNPLTLDVKAMGGGTSAERGIVLVPTEVGANANFLRIGDTNLPHLQVNANGNVGIGTASPAYLLDVNGTAHIAGATTLSDTLAVAGDAAFDTDTLFVATAGNAVGIGTTSPAAKLDVTGGVKMGADAVCNASKAGMVAWNANRLQVCDGAAFRNVSAIEELDDIGDVYVSEAGTPNNNDILAWNATDSRWEAKNVSTVGSAVADPGGLDKQVQFNDGGTLAGAAQLYWDKATNRLGLGTTTPSDRLTIQDGVISFNSTGTFGALRFALQDSTATYTNTADEKILLLGATGMGGGDTSFGYKLSWRNADGSPRINALLLHKDGGVSIGGGSYVHASALLDLTSTTKGFLPPRMTTAQRDAIASPATGLVIFNTTTNSLELRNSTAWVALGSGGGGTTLPNCADGETIVRQGGAWVCSDMPDVFAFTDLTGQATNTLVNSNILPVTGALQATVTISGTGSPQYRICADASCASVIRNWTNAASTINQGQHLQLRVTTATTTDGATRTATVQIGQISDAWSVSTQDDTPDAFSFADVTGQPASTLITSNTLTITGIGPNPTAVSVTGTGSPQVSINGGAWTTSGTILPGQTLTVRLTSAGTSSTTRSATVTVGNSSDTWSVTTVPQDNTPNAFDFADVANQPANTVVTSAANAITGIGPDPVSVSITGAGSPQISINGGAWTTSGTILNGQTLQLRLTSHTVTDGTSRSATVTVGTASDTWSVITQDDTPAAFSFTDVTNQAVNTVITSNTLTITGIGGNATPVSVTGSGSPQVSINGGAWTTSGTILAGQTLAVRLTSAGTSSTTRSATVTVGNSSDTWSVTTIPQDNTPSAFDFTNLTNQLFSTLVTSNVVTITGIGPDPVNVSISGGGSPEFSIAGGAWVTSGTITNGQTLQLRMTTSPSSNTTLTATVTVGTVSDSWSTTTQLQDDTPNAFAFTDVTGQRLAAVITSNTLTITGIGPAPVSVSVTGAGSPQISINGGAWATNGSISNGQTLAIRLTSASTSNTARSATVTVGTVSDTWSVTTATVTAGSQNFTTAGTHSFTVPHHQTLTVQVWGAGGGGAGCSTYTEVQGGNGGSSSWNGAVVANGGARASTSAGGAGGTASGGTTNTTGQAGSTHSSYGAKGGNGASGGAGGAQRTSNGNGNGGSAPGGGGGGARFVSRGSCNGDGGGGGGYSTRAYSAGTFVQGSSVTVVVGAGGSKGNGSTYDGGAGAVGRVTISWN